MKTVMLVFGTRPEAIKMCPLVNELKSRKNIKTIVCVTGQHRQMLDQVLETFNIKPDYDLSIMKEKQTLFDVTINILDRIRDVLDEAKPDVVLVHGDTSTTFVTALACFYKLIPIGHVEAGLRTYNVYSPYPEEFNRQCVGIMAKWHFAPTELAKQNLLNEGKIEENIFVTGNTVLDAHKTTLKPNFEHPVLKWSEKKRLFMLTAHRRENTGETMRGIFRAARRICDSFEEVRFFYPVHKNPSIKSLAEKELGNHKSIMLCEPLDPVVCHNLMSRCFGILTDSGGIQEEATAMGKPTLVLRSTTERPEGVEAGVLTLVGTNEDSIYDAAVSLLNGEAFNNKLAKQSPYGDGTACKKIADVICNHILT